MNIHEVIKLSELLAEMGQIKRLTMLPNHEAEPDSHHAFSLALISYQIVRAECPELDADKVVLYALAHDLLEIITGDEVTPHYTPSQHDTKLLKEKQAVKEFSKIFEKYPDLVEALEAYEKLDTKEAATVFVLDKASTTWTHHIHKAEYARKNNLHSKQDVAAWAERTRQKFTSRLTILPPQRILDIFEESYVALRDLYDD